MTTDGGDAGDGQLLLGLDIGSSRTKALLVDGDGRNVGATTVPTPFVTSGDATEATVEGILAAAALAVEGLGRAARQVAGVGIAGLAESGAPLDQRGVPLAPIIAWHDRRGDAVADRLMDRFGPPLVGRFGQRLRSVSSVAKLGWHVEQGIDGLTRWLGVPELVLLSLTGVQATEHSLAARTGCRDIGQGVWIGEVADAAGFDVGVFPEVRPAGTSMGEVTAEAARTFGLVPGIPVTIAGHDHLVGTVGSGAKADDLANSVGTAETVVGRSASLPDVVAAVDRRLAVTVFPGGDGWAVLASAARPGLVLDAAAATLGQSLATLDQMAEGAELLDAPGLTESLRRREPPVLPEGPPGAVWHTLLHHLAALTADAAVRVVGLLGPRRRLIVFGGGAASGPWMEAKAELAPLPVWRMAAPEAVARGAAVYAGVAAGWWPAPAAAPAPPLELA